MSKRFPPIEPLRLLPYALLLTAGLIWLYQSTLSLKSDAKSARTAVTASLSQTKFYLTNLVGQASQQSSLTTNLEQGYTNALAQILQSYLKPGELSQLELYDENCALVSRATLAKPLAAPCKTEMKKNSLHWIRDQDGHGALGSSSTISVDSRSFILIGYVVLDRSWIAAHADIAKLVDTGFLALTPNSPSRAPILWKDSDGAETTFYVTDWRYFPFNNLMNISLEKTSADPTWVCLGMLSLLALVGLLNDSFRREKFKQTIREAYSHMAAGTGQEPHVDEPLMDIWLRTKSHWENQLVAKSNQVKLIQDRLSALQSQLRDRDREVAHLEGKLSALAELNTLREQLQKTTASFLKQMQQVRSTCEDLYDISTEGLAVHSKELRTFYHNWQKGVQDNSSRERGARKFLRSLSETPGRVAGETMLDSELRKLGDLSSACLDQALHAAMLTKQILNDTEFAAQIVSLWHGLAEHQKKEFEPADWCDSALQAQKLLTAEPPYNLLSFANLKPTIDADYPTLPAPILVSSLYHLYLALLSDIPLDLLDSTIKLQEELAPSAAHLNFDASITDSKYLGAAPSRLQNYHLDIAKSLLAPFSIHVAFGSMRRVVITWKRSTAEVSVNYTESSDAISM